MTTRKLRHPFDFFKVRKLKMTSLKIPELTTTDLTDKIAIVTGMWKKMAETKESANINELQAGHLVLALLQQKSSILGVPKFIFWTLLH